MASWMKSSIYWVTLAILLIALVSFTTARRQDVYNSNYEIGNYGQLSDSQGKGYDGYAFSVRDNLNSHNANYISDSSDLKKVTPGDSRDISAEVKKALKDYQHNLKYHSDNHKYYVDNSSTAPAPAPATANNSTNSTAPASPADEPIVMTINFSENATEIKQRGTFPWILMAFIVIGFGLIAALLFLTMGKKDSFTHGNIKNDFPAHKQEHKVDEEQINKEIQDALNKNTVVNNQGL